MFCFTVYFYAYFYSVEAVAQSGLILLQPLHRELPFQKGDIVYIIRQVDQNWYEGEHHGRVGIFPQSYVEVCELFPVQTSALWMFCLFAFSAAYFTVQTPVSAAPPAHRESPAKEKRPGAGAGIRGGHRPLQLHRGHSGGDVLQEGVELLLSSSSSACCPFFCAFVCVRVFFFSLLLTVPHLAPRGRGSR